MLLLLLSSFPGTFNKVSDKILPLTSLSPTKKSLLAQTIAELPTEFHKTHMKYNSLYITLCICLGLNKMMTK